jgi:hypothetical protein
VRMDLYQAVEAYEINGQVDRVGRCCFNSIDTEIRL